MADPDCLHPNVTSRPDQYIYSGVEAQLLDIYQRSRDPYKLHLGTEASGNGYVRTATPQDLQ
jgi:hypothetical protein